MGGAQLCRAVRAVEHEFQSLKKVLGIDVEYEQLRVVPLLVSTSPEFDFELFSGAHKISLFEMKALLDPEMFVHAQAIISSYNKTSEMNMETDASRYEAIASDLQRPEFLVSEMERATRECADVSEDITSEPAKLIKAIESRIFWQELEKHPELQKGQVERGFRTKDGDGVRYVI